MAIGTNLNFTGEDASRAMLEGLTNRIRDELRVLILERLEPDIQTAVDAGLSAFKATIESYRDPMHMRDTVHVIIERRDLHLPQGREEQS
jgi:hypothetical protein